MTDSRTHPRSTSGAREAAAALLAGCLSLSGCFALGGDEGPVERNYEVTPPLEVSARQPGGRRDCALQVERFTADDTLSDTEIVWRRGVESGAYAHHRWTRPPAASARQVLTEALQAAGVCQVIASEPPLEQPPTYRLDAHLSRFGEQDRPEGWFGVVELTAVLRDGEGLELWRRTYAAAEPVDMRNPLGVARAVGRALDELAGAIASDVDRALAHASEPRRGA